MILAKELPTGILVKLGVNSLHVTCMAKPHSTGIAGVKTQ
jgi:hypothetical protein